jgi:hypothetical protein
MGPPCGPPIDVDPSNVLLLVDEPIAGVDDEPMHMERPM